MNLTDRNRANYFNIKQFIVTNGSTTIKVNPTGTIVDQRADITLTCETSSPANITWRKYLSDISSDTVTNIGNQSKLNLVNINDTDAGNYTCLVWNSSTLLEQSSIAKVFVNCKSLEQPFFM